MSDKSKTKNGKNIQSLSIRCSLNSRTRRVELINVNNISQMDWIAMLLILYWGLLSTIRPTRYFKIISYIVVTNWREWQASTDHLSMTLNKYHRMTVSISMNFERCDDCARIC